MLERGFSNSIMSGALRELQKFNEVKLLQSARSPVDCFSNAFVNQKFPKQNLLVKDKNSICKDEDFSSK